MRTSIQHIGRHLVRSLSYRVTLSQEKIEQRVNGLFPLETGRHGISLKLENPEIRLNEAENRIHLLTDVNIILPGQLHASGHLEAAGSLVYDPAEGAFFFDNPEICQFSVLSIPSRYMFPLKKLMTTFLARYVAGIPVYKFQGNSLKHRLAKAVLKDVEVHRGRLEIRFSFGRPMIF